MPGNTANYGWQYPTLSDAPNGAAQMQTLATAIDAQVATNQAAQVAAGYGRIGSAYYTTVGANVTATEVEICTFTTNCVAGRRYRAYMTVSPVYGVVSDVGWFPLRYAAGSSVSISSTILFVHEVPCPGNTHGVTTTAIWEFISPGTGQFTFGMSAQYVTGTGSMHIVPAANQPCQLAIDDIGT